MTSLERAIHLAVKAHAGQKDKAGSEYILHPLRVMNQMKTKEEKIIAVLHDVIEDSKITCSLLKAEGFSDTIITAITILTKEETVESYEEYIARIKAHPLARKVKLADLEDNMNIKRIKDPGMADFIRLEKYHKAWHYLCQP